MLSDQIREQSARLEEIEASLEGVLHLHAESKIVESLRAWLLSRLVRLAEERARLGRLSGLASRMEIKLEKSKAGIL